VQVASELGGRGRLARALKADKDDDGRVACQSEASISGRKERHQLFVDDLHDLLAGGKGSRGSRRRSPFPDTRHEVLHDLEVDVGLEQSQSHFAHGGIDVVGADSTVAGQSTKRLAQPLAQGIEHGRWDSP